MSWDCIFGIASTLAAIVIVGGGIAGLWAAWRWAVVWWDDFLDDGRAPWSDGSVVDE
jgi:hypothetical protein